MSRLPGLFVLAGFRLRPEGVLLATFVAVAKLGQRRGGIGHTGGDRVGRCLAQANRPQQRQQMLVSPGRHSHTPA